MRTLLIASFALLIMLSSHSGFAGDKKVTRLGEGGGGMKKPDQKTSSNKMHSIGKSETHYLIMITGYDKQSRSYIVANKDARRAAEKEIAFERRYFSRILSETKEEWYSDDATRHQRFPQLSSRSLRVRGTYRSAAEAQEKKSKAQEADARMQQKKNEPKKLYTNSKRGKNGKNNKHNKGQITLGETRTIGRVTEEKKVTRLGNSADGALGRVEGSDVAKWGPDQAMAEASKRLEAKFQQYLANQGPTKKEYTIKPE